MGLNFFIIYTPPLLKSGKSGKDGQEISGKEGNNENQPSIKGCPEAGRNRTIWGQTK
jgi:hypothetical protein